MNGNEENEHRAVTTEPVTDKESKDLASPAVRRSARAVPRKSYELYEDVDFSDESSSEKEQEPEPERIPASLSRKKSENTVMDKPETIPTTSPRKRARPATKKAISETAKTPASPRRKSIKKGVDKIVSHFQCCSNYASNYIHFCAFAKKNDDERVEEKTMDGSYITRINFEEYVKFKNENGMPSSVSRDIRASLKWFCKNAFEKNYDDIESQVVKDIFQELKENKVAKKASTQSPLRIMPSEMPSTTLPSKRNRTQTKIYTDEIEEELIQKRPKKRKTNKPKPAAHCTNGPALAMKTKKDLIENYGMGTSYAQQIVRFYDFVDNNDDERICKSADGSYLTRTNVDELFKFRQTSAAPSMIRQIRKALIWFAENVEKKKDFNVDSPIVDEIVLNSKEYEQACKKTDIVVSSSQKTPTKKTGKESDTKITEKKLKRMTLDPNETWSLYCDWVDKAEGVEKTEDNRYLTRDNVDKYFSEYLQSCHFLSPRQFKNIKSDLVWCASNIEMPKYGTDFKVDSLLVEEAIAKYTESYAKEEEEDEELPAEELLVAMALDRVKFELKEDPNKYYIEDEAHLYHNPPLPSRESQGIKPEDLKPIPPPEPLPEFPTTGKCVWKFDESHRVLLADFSPCSNPSGVMEPGDERFFLQMLERNDITVISEGLVSTQVLDPALWKLQHMEHALGEEYYHKFRRFDTFIDRKGFEKCKEVDSLLSMKIGDYISYLNKRQEHLSKKLEDPSFYFIDHEGKERNIKDVGISALYMIDMDIIKSLPGLYSNFMKSFRFGGLLPGGSYCMMNKVTPSARPFMGPNMYVTPPASFTHFHQDGHGTVDSGHLCLNGYNEVVMLRRLTERHKKHALMILTGSLQDGRHGYFDGLYQVPHGDELGEKPAWPTKDKIEQCRQMGYCPTVFILKPGQLVHINKGRLHAFRKMSTARLPDDDCHKELREALIKERNIVGEQLCISIAWDWMFLGVTARGINREVLTVLEAAILNRKNGKMSLAIPEMSLLQMAKFLPPPEDNELPTDLDDMVGFMNTHFKEETDRKICNATEIYRGILPGLRHVVTEHITAIKVAAQEDSQSLERGKRVTVAKCPNAREKPSASAVDPYGNSGDFLCKLCNKELSNVYFHCDGCEKFLSKDFNICRQCHADQNYMITVQMHPMNPKRHSTLNHIGNFHYNRTIRCICKNGPVCDECGYCLGCSCRCHTWFTLHKRLFDKEEEEELLSRVVKTCSTTSNGDSKIFDPEFVQGRIDVASRKYDD